MRVRDLISVCDGRGELCKVTEEVHREAIPGFIQDEEQEKNPAILFENVKGYQVPVLAKLEYRGELAVAKCGTVDIEVPVGSEIVIEGVVSTDLEPEGPFGDWTGCYARPQNKPTLQITRISHRKNPVYQTILPGTSKEQILLIIVRFYPELEALRERYLEIQKLSVPDYGLGRLAVIAVRQSPNLNRIMDDFLKIQCINRVIVVNEDVDVNNPADVLWAMSNRILEKEKVLTYSCDDEWWNNLKLGIDTTVDFSDIRHVRTEIIKSPPKRV